MSGDSTKECDRYLLSGSSGWSILNDPADFDTLPRTSTSPQKSPAFALTSVEVTMANRAIGISSPSAFTWAPLARLPFALDQRPVGAIPSANVSTPNPPPKERERIPTTPSKEVDETPTGPKASTPYSVPTATTPVTPSPWTP